MRLAELHPSVGILEDFHSKRAVVCTVLKDQDGSYPVSGQYVSVWSVLPDPDPATPGAMKTNHNRFIGLGLIDSVVDEGQSTNCVVVMLNEGDGLYPFFPGARLPGSTTFHPFNQEPKRCQGVFGVIPRCDKPITRLTQHYQNMICDSCYPESQKRDDASLVAEMEMMENPSRLY